VICTTRSRGSDVANGSERPCKHLGSGPADAGSMRFYGKPCPHDVSELHVCLTSTHSRHSSARMATARRAKDDQLLRFNVRQSTPLNLMDSRRYRGAHRQPQGSAIALSSILSANPALPSRILRAVNALQGLRRRTINGVRQPAGLRDPRIARTRSLPLYAISAAWL
jgi:hypothetical protein